MPSCLLVLQRYFLRVDSVIFRLYETRVYLDFAKPYLVREWVRKEADDAFVREVRTPVTGRLIIRISSTNIQRNAAMRTP